MDVHGNPAFNRGVNYFGFSMFSWFEGSICAPRYGVIEPYSGATDPIYSDKANRQSRVADCASSAGTLAG